MSLEELSRERGIAAIVVTHNPRLAERFRRRLHLDKTGLHDLTAEAAKAAAAASPAE